MRKSANFNFAMIAAIAVLGLFLAGCQGTVSPPGQGSNGWDERPFTEPSRQQEFFEEAQVIKTNNFKSDEEYLAFLKSSSLSSNNYYGAGQMRAFSTDMIAAEAPLAMESAGKAASADGGAGVDYSETNNQVAGVDEADIIKTDGKYIYTVSGDTVFIIMAVPGEDAEVISTIKYDETGEGSVTETPAPAKKIASVPSRYYYSNNVQGLFVNKDKLVVFGRYNNLNFFKDSGFRPRNGMTYFNIYDISDKESPKLVEEFKFEGSYFQSRMVGENVYFVTMQSPEYRRDYPTPLMYIGEDLVKMPVDDIYYFNIPYTNVQLANINAINLKDDEVTDSKSVAVEYGQNMYMSEDNIYITYTENINEWELQQEVMVELAMDFFTQEDKDVVKKIEDTDTDVLSNAEKRSKVVQLAYEYMQWMDEKEQQDLQDKTEELLKKKLEQYEYFEYTIINRVSVDNGEIAVEANGKVPGHIINQFSMDEYNGVFRIATTLNARWNNWIAQDADEEAVAEQKLSSSNIFTLDQDLEVLDSLKGIAKGEQIYSTRFMGKRLYMVTFRQVDPFFVFDLSDSEDIKELGKLKIPGFSRYLHPYDENTIIGLGRDTNLNGGQEGLKISLFDVSDPEHPVEKAKFVTASDYASSVAEYEHKAFLFNKEKELLVIPAYSYGEAARCFSAPCPTPAKGFNGAMVFSITEDKIKMRGIVDHAQGQQYYSPTVERSLFIDDLLYTKSPGLLRINKLSDLSKVKNIELNGYDSEYPVY